MHSLSLSLAYLRHRLLGTVLTVITFASGISVIVALMLLNAQLQNEFTKNLQGIDLVVSGKGSPLQIILSTVFQLDIPTGNIPFDAAQKLQHHPLVQQAIPMALGDNYNGARIVGTNAAYIEHYHGSFAQGHVFTAPMQAVLGSDVATLHLGDHFVGAHGLVNSDDLHTEFPYTVVGILAPTHTVLDRVVITPVESVWQVHAKPDADNPEEIAYKKAHPGKELTALLIHYQSPLAASLMPRLVNKDSAMQAASPAFEVARLTNFMGVGADTFEVFGLFLIVLAAFGIFTALYNAMGERRYDLALMRSFGASPAKLLGLVLTESLIVAALGVILGEALGHGFVAIAAQWLAGEKHLDLTGALFLADELWLVAGGLLIGVLAALLPALRVYRIDIFETLVRG